MDENPAALAERTSVWSRVCNIFVAPGEVFEEVKSSPPSTSNWFVPALLVALIGIACGSILMSRDWAQQQVRDLTERSVEQQLAKAGMKPEQMEAQKAMALKIGEISAKVGVIVGPIVGGFATPFWYALFLWPLGNKALKGRLPYMRAVEVAGLAMMIGLLEAVVKTLLIFVQENIMASPTPALMIKELDLTNKVHHLLLTLNPFSLWSLAVMASGLATLTSASFARAAGWLFGLWVVFKAAVVALGLGRFGM
jgi:hypothetical protein